MSPLVSGTAPIVTVPASPTTDQDVSDEALYSRAGSIERGTGDIELLGYRTTDQPVKPQSRIYLSAVSLNRDTGDI